MEPFLFHVYVCDQRKPEGAPSCPARGSGAVIEALRREIAARGLSDAVQLTTCGSLGLCERGPNLVVYPEGHWYSGVLPEDVPEIVREHLGRGRPVARLASGEPAALAAEIAGNRRKALAAVAARDAAGVVPDDIAVPLRAFMESRVLLTALELDLFTAVGGGATAATVASAVGAAAGATERLLDALVSLGFLDKREGAFANTPLASRFLAASSPDDARDALKHNLSLWRRWSTLTDAVRAGHAVGVAEMADRGDDWTVPFIAAMHRGAAARAPLVVQAVGTEGVRRMLDVGGGSGAYSIAFARASAALRAEILDLPAVLPIAEGHVAEAGLAARVTTRPGDLRTDDLGSGYDVVLLSSICHMLGPEENRDLLSRAARALAPGGRVVVSDFVLDEGGTSPRQAVLFSINMLVGTPSGRSYRESDYRAWLEAAGLVGVSRARLPGPAHLLIGRKPAV
ncbi:MAG TPA: methyltransferase [Vicinamibacteria bacterium]|nr:methyltransferase [Vicinamibacteria bacterium]